jgi:LPPG:FO 2-phospho-L-lactate transferase
LKPAPTVLAVCGGVGGAKLALGLQHALPPGELATLVNTGDDFTHLGLRICPDLDTVLYTLAGVVHPQQGWGRAEETFGFMAELRRQGGPEWFLLGDRDLVVHVERTRRLAAGERLTAVTADLAQRFGVPSRILPMTDSEVATLLETDAGPLEFQHYFVRLRCEPQVRSLSFAGAVQARPSPELTAVLRGSALRAIILCPSNPFLSIDPVLAVPGMRAALRAARVPIVAVSPLIGGRAVKGPTAKIMRELGLQAGSGSILRHYAGLIDGLVVDAADAADAGTLEAAAAAGVAVAAERTLMQSLDDRIRVARAALSMAEALRPAAAARRAS